MNKPTRKGGFMSFYGPKQLIDSIRTVRKNTIAVRADCHSRNPKRDLLTTL
jgi:hypothetical protein